MEKKIIEKIIYSCKRGIGEKDYNYKEWNCVNRGFPPGDAVKTRSTALKPFKKIHEAGRGAAARGVTATPTGCGFDPHSRR